MDERAVCRAFLPTSAVTWATVAGAVLLTAGSCAAAPSSPSAMQGRVPDGSLGGIGIRIDVVASETRLEFDCAHASLAPLVLDADNQFDVTGALVLEHAGPLRQDEPERTEPARYRGRLDGETVTLSVTLTDSGESAGSYSATRGQPPRLRKCR